MADGNAARGIVHLKPYLEFVRCVFSPGISQSDKCWRQHLYCIAGRSVLKIKNNVFMYTVCVNPLIDCIPVFFFFFVVVVVFRTNCHIYMYHLRLALELPNLDNRSNYFQPVWGNSKYNKSAHTPQGIKSTWLEIKASLTPSQKDKVLEFLSAWKHVFSKGTSVMGGTNLVEHHDHTYPSRGSSWARKCKRW